MRRHVLGLIDTRESPRKRYGRRLNGLATLASARLSCPWRLGPVSVVSNPSIAERADKVVRIIVDTYVLPNKTVQELRALVESGALEPLRDFSEACREELSLLSSQALQFEYRRA
jgi:hypothetical protein